MQKAKNHRIIALLAIGYTCFLITFLLIQIALFLNTKNSTDSLNIDFDFLTDFGIRLHFIFDPLALLFQIGTSIVILFGMIFSLKESKRLHNASFYICTILILTVSILLFSVADLFIWIMLWEALSILIYVFIKILQKDTLTVMTHSGRFLFYSGIANFLMIISIVMLAYNNWSINNEWTFDYESLIKTPISSTLEFILMLGFLLAFVIRLPLLPFHQWLIDIHHNQKESTSIIINIVILNSAFYGIIKYALPLFPNASICIVPAVNILCFVTFFYAIFLCYTQKTMKSLIIYMQIVLVSYITLIIYNGTFLSYQGTLLILIKVGLIATALFIVSSFITNKRIISDKDNNQKLFISAKHLLILTQFFIFYYLLIPGTSNILILYDNYSQSLTEVILIALGLFLLAVSVVMRMQSLYNLGEYSALNRHQISLKQLFFITIIMALLLFIGLYPKWILELSQPWSEKLNLIINAAKTNALEGANS